MTNVWKVIFFTILLCTRATGTATVCYRTISIYCPQMIFFMSINATSDLASSLLEQCNGHQECHVPNVNVECVEIHHGCFYDRDSLEMKMSSTVQFDINDNYVNMFSANYLLGKYQFAQNIFCYLNGTGLASPGLHGINFHMIEFAPYIKSTDYCLKADGIAIFCSGSQVLMPNLVYTGNSMGQFEMMLSNKAMNLPKVRFWIGLYGAKGRKLTCHSQPVVFAGSTKPGQSCLLGMLVIFNIY